VLSPPRRVEQIVPIGVLARIKHCQDPRLLFADGALEHGRPMMSAFVIWFIRCGAYQSEVEAWLRRQPEAKLVTSYIGAGAPRFYRWVGRY
jgi:hypothetical protein